MTTKVLLIIFNGYNTLDVAAPYETFRTTNNRTAFSVCTASQDFPKPTISVEGQKMVADISLSDVVVSDYDILVVPGGDLGPIRAMPIHSHFMRVIKEFAGLDSKLLFSICTGAFFLGALGILTEYCTTHWACVDDLAKLIGPGKVIRARFVDVMRGGQRLVTSGGISCGLDASLYVINLVYGESAAFSTAETIDYAWRKTDGVVFDWQQG